MKRDNQKKGARMNNKAAGIVTAILQGVGILLLLAAAFDITGISDNMMIFSALSAFIISGIIKRIASGGCGCK